MERTVATLLMLVAVAIWGFLRDCQIGQWGQL